MTKRAIVWFRNNLRLDDNPSIVEAAKVAQVIPVYVFDNRTFKGTTRQFGFPKTNIHRARFILESVIDLRERLRALGSDLIVRVGLAEEEVAGLASEVQSAWVYCNRERTCEEVAIQDKLESMLWGLGQELRYQRGKMLYHTGDLPFPVSHTPDTFTQFRKEVERIVPVREPLASPDSLPALPPGLDPGRMPTLQDLGYEDQALGQQGDPRAAIEHRGGETAGLARLKYYLWESHAAKTYKDTRNGLEGADYSTKFSAWLAEGCLSPKRIVYELRKYETEHGANESTYWIFFELMWRDFFRLMAKKYGNAIFQISGPKGAATKNFSLVASTDQEIDWDTFKRWAEGTTGVPFIDANMRELNATGFISNRGRQNVASFLVNDLKINWQIGAEYFESLLIDYDVTSNWGNWNYIAKIGADPREDRYFNILSQTLRFDPDGSYVKRWVPELTNLPKDRIHRPDLLTDSEQAKLNIRIGIDYPKAIVDISRWDPNNYSDRIQRPSNPGDGPQSTKFNSGDKRKDLITHK